MSGYPRILTPINHVEPVPRRIRATLAAETVFDTTRALYVWEWPNYPQFYIPAADVRADLLMDEGRTEQTARGPALIYGLRAGDKVRSAAVRWLAESAIDGLADMLRFKWAALDAWYEEDEQVFVHPRDPYTRVDSLRSTRHVRVELDGLVLAESDSPVMVFETGLPTRYYLNRTDLNMAHLVDSDSVSVCPYKGTTSRYWSVRTSERVYPDLAWAYDFPTRDLLPIAGMVAFYNEKVDIWLDGHLLDRPTTHFA
jgi:uncharacterized protein (DUF427 family)